MAIVSSSTKPNIADSVLASTNLPTMSGSTLFGKLSEIIPPDDPLAHSIAKAWKKAAERRKAKR